ncbi:LrgB family protein [Opacimonas viscosa]|uniref:LrgB family protein n=1 Tax=Opacimonas viscosa TaxID=2961944 RepID=A0AA41X1E8_9ALTE|nr:LrgB family protein [Opacimonas viscosa]MCP3427716.1 LrgB family protein [Opacimonas viscosa]
MLAWESLLDTLPTSISDVALWTAVVVLSYAFALRVAVWTKHNVLLHPLLLSSMLVLLFALGLTTPVTEVVEHISILYWLLGPVTVALALPVYSQISVIKKLGGRILLPILLGGTLAPLTAWLVFWLSGLEEVLQLTILTKSITTPLAMDTAKIIGGIPELSVLFLMITGIFSAIIIGPLLTQLHIKDDRISGLSLGTIAHAIGTAKALQISEQAGAFATLALCVNGIATAIIMSAVLG